MTYGWHDLLGIIGVVLIVATYMLLQLEKLSATSFLYSAANGLGASLILVSLIYDFNLSAFIIEVRNWVKFCRESKRGIMGLQGITKASKQEAPYEKEEERKCATVN